ncbi:thioesterase domain-containing protein, partial [Mariniflexile sp.]|uniref:thioesterase domain-containing protein n=1 Tax=Mariniflexile sp. TaxID=1979402 RepID=UPI003561BEA6
YIEAITKANPKGPYALAGYSFGGIIAYEMAKQMLAQNKKITMLGMLDTYANPIFSYTPSLKRKLVALQHRFKSNIYATKHLFSNSEAFKTRLNAQKQKVSNLILGLKNGKEKHHQLRYHQPYRLDKMNRLAISRYKLTPIDMQINLFRVEKQGYYMQDPVLLGWEGFALKGVKVHEIPGDHNYLFSPPNDKISAHILQHVLDRHHDDSAHNKNTK